MTLLEYNDGKKIDDLPKTWLQAFSQLKLLLKRLKGNEKKVVFLDEISWFETPRSGFLAALDNFWNQFCSKREDIILVICGSAASWIIKKVINNRGGLHNRITTHLKLLPFTLNYRMFFNQNQNHAIPNHIPIICYHLHFFQPRSPPQMAKNEPNSQ